MTIQAHQKKRQEIQAIQAQLEAAKEDMNIAKEQGDLSENFGYQESRKNVENLNRQIASRMEDMAGLQIIDPLDWAENDMEGLPRCMVGTCVTLLRDGKEESYLIGGMGDNIPGVIPYNSPLGKAIIAKPEGTEVELNVTDSPQKIKIVSCTVPTKAALEKLYNEPKPQKPTVTKPQIPEDMEMA